jgi:hypothetical protein
MKTNRIVPAALAATLIVAGGASQALAESDLADHTLPPYFTQKPMQQAAAQDQGMSSSQAMKGDLTLSQAEQKVEQKVGGGKIIATDTYGMGNNKYWIDIKKGDTTDRVYVNGKTGKVSVIDANLFGVDRNSDDDGHRG